MAIYKGNCCCDLIEFECEGEPFFTQYCHCNKCREMAERSTCINDKHGYAFTAAYLVDHFTIVNGQDQLEGIIKNNAKLYCCRGCKSLIYGISLDPNLQAGIGVNAFNFHFKDEMPDAFKPVRHIWYEDRIMDFHDELPKFKDAPENQGGTGEVLG